MNIFTQFWQFVTRSSSSTINPAPWFVKLWGGTKTNAGEYVNAETSLQSATLYACVNLIADSISSLPWQLKSGDEILFNSQITRLLSRQPNEKMSAIDFKRALIVNVLTYGNGYVIPVRNGTKLSSLELVDSQSVNVELRANGQLLYTVQLFDRSLELLPHQIIHIKAFTMDGYTGVSPVVYARETIGTDLSATKHAGSFYGNGASLKGYISIAGTIRDPAKQKQIGTDFDTNYGGGADNSGKTAVLTEGADYKTVSSSMRDSQFIETQKWTTEEIARIYKVPPHKIGHLETGTTPNSIEQQNDQFVQDCLRFWIENLELEFTNKLVNNNAQRIEIDFSALIRGDINSQVQQNVSYWNIGVLSANEIRSSLGLKPVPGGDELFKPLAMSNQNDVNNGKEERPNLQKGEETN